MVDRCRIVDPEDDEGTLDRVAMTVSRSAPPIIYEGPCRVHMMRQHRRTGAAQEQNRVDELGLELPLSVEQVRVGQTVYLIGPSHDDDIWAEFEITRINSNTSPLARQCVIERVVAEPTTGGESV